MRKLVLYAGLGGCFLLALILERMFTRPPKALGADSALFRLGGDGPRIAIPERPQHRLDEANLSADRTRANGRRSSDDVSTDSTSPRRSNSPNAAGEREPRPKTASEIPISASKARYRVRENESLWGLADRFLGDGARWPALAELNGISQPSELLAGMDIWVPEAAAETSNRTGPQASRSTEKARQETNPRPADAEAAKSLRKYQVKSGDTLSEIAQRELGSAALWKKISDLNRLKTEQVVAGDILLLPPRS